MGLDIYVRKGKRNADIDSERLNDVYSDLYEQNKKEYLGKLRTWRPSSYKSEESAVKGFFKLLEKYDCSSYRYCEYEGSKWVPKFKTLEEVNAIIKEILDADEEDIYPNSALYYRKVNFLYAFFSDKIDNDTQSAYISKGDVERLVEMCEKALGDKKNAHEYLPTRSGFFFGSTDYDKWYFYDVRKVKREFKRLLKKWDDDDVVIIYFSW